MVVFVGTYYIHRPKVRPCPAPVSYPCVNVSIEASSLGGSGNVSALFVILMRDASNLPLVPKSRL